MTPSSSTAASTRLTGPSRRSERTRASATSRRVHRRKMCTFRRDRARAVRPLAPAGARRADAPPRQGRNAGTTCQRHPAGGHRRFPDCRFRPSASCTAARARHPGGRPGHRPVNSPRSRRGCGRGAGCAARKWRNPGRPKPFGPVPAYFLDSPACDCHSRYTE